MMATEIDLADDIIDVRSVIERFEDLDAHANPDEPTYLTGYEMEPGYMAVSTDGGECEACGKVVADLSAACPAISDRDDVYAHVRRLSDAETVSVDA